MGISTLMLLLANLGPLYGVLYLDWSVTMLFFLYWSETGIVIFFTLLKMLLTRASVGAKLGYGLFFLVHSSVFMFAHLFFLIAFVAPGDPQLNTLLDDPAHPFEEQLKWVYLGFMLVHGLSFLLNYVYKKEYLKASIQNLVISIYSRIGFIHVIIIVCGIIYMKIFKEQGDASVVFMSFAVALKTGLDLFAHFRSHRALQKR